MCWSLLTWHINFVRRVKGFTRSFHFESRREKKKLVSAIRRLCSLRVKKVNRRVLLLISSDSWDLHSISCRFLRKLGYGIGELGFQSNRWNLGFSRELGFKTICVSIDLGFLSFVIKVSKRSVCGLSLLSIRNPIIWYVWYVYNFFIQMFDMFSQI